ncbi:MAG TPA: L-histidine N(alpha)-methyltransferase [bacterium]
MATPTITVHESRAPEKRAGALRQALQAHRLPGHVLYEGPGQAQRWLAYHQAWSPSRTEAALQALYREACGMAVGALGGPLHAVSLGCGGGRKDGDLLDAVPAAMRAGSHYTPLDASAALVTEVSEHVKLRHPGVTQHPIEADLEAEPPLRTWLDDQDGGTLARLFSCFGMIPNFDAETFPRYLASLVRAQDGLLFSANLSPGGFAVDRDRILRQYDNPEARAWYRGALEALGIASADYTLTLTATPLVQDGSRWQIAADATTLRRVRAKTGGVTHPLPEGERLRVFFSNRFTPNAIAALLASAGLIVTKSWMHATGEEGIFWCRRKR